MANIADRKKTITGIMVSLLILILVFSAVSTATYAWYSTINRAVGDSISFTSAASDESGGDLAIGWDTAATAGIITFNPPESELFPMIPKIEPTIGSTSYGEFIANNFNYSSQKYDDTLGAWITSFAGVTTSPFRLNGTPSKNTMFYVINKLEQDKQSITVKYSILGDLADSLRVALFMGDAGDTPEETLAGLKLAGIMSKSTFIHFGNIQKDDIVDETETMSGAYRASGTIKFDIEASSYKCLALVAWLDGVFIVDEHSLLSASFNLLLDGILGGSQG